MDSFHKNCYYHFLTFRL